MNTLYISRIAWIIGLLLLSLVILIVLELVYIKYNGVAVPAPTIAREPRTFGSGDPLTYVVLGDSTTVAQGGDYDKGIAIESARHLGKRNLVTMHNFGVSGARTADVLEEQVPKALNLKADIVLVSVTANDVTHLSGITAVRRDLSAVIDQLRSDNSDVKIVVTGSPQLGSVARFPEPIKTAARYRTAQINRMVADLAREKQVTIAPVAERTGQAFMDDPSLFAADKFHPNNRGYRLWTAVITDTFDTILR